MEEISNKKRTTWRSSNNKRHSEFLADDLVNGCKTQRRRDKGLEPVLIQRGGGEAKKNDNWSECKEKNHS